MNPESGSSDAIRSRQRAAFAAVTTLFFAWGFITVTVDPLIATLKALYKLSFAEVMLTQFSFFMAYGIVSLPASVLVARLGYPKTIVSALATMVSGCLCVLVATHFDSFAVVLVALFVIASGITVLQVAANPLAALLGAPERSHYRLTLSQAFNSLGTALAPYLVSSLILAGGIFVAQGGVAVTAVQRSESLRHIDVAFLVIAAALGLLAIFAWSIRARLTRSAVAAHERSPRIVDALRSPWALSGAVAIFLYVGAEVSIGSTMTNFLHQNDVLGVTLERAGKLVSLYWGGAMIGRFVGSALLTRLRAGVLLGVAAIVASLLCLFVGRVPGASAGYAALAIGFLNSIMFPVIFTLTLERSKASAAAVSGLLCMAIVGGAVLPLLMGRLADIYGLRMAYFVPMVAYAGIGAFGVTAARARTISAPPTIPATSAH